MKNLINLTQHNLSDDQIQDFTDMVEDYAVSVFNRISSDAVKKLLTFDTLPTKEDLQKRAEELVNLIEVKEGYALIGGAPYFMAPLETALKNAGIIPIYAFSVRDSVEEQSSDGTVIKKSIFRHGGYILA